jgi:hypothetical protein
MYDLKLGSLFMKFWIKRLVLYFVLSVNSLHAKTLIVSDVDDTIKITNVLAKAKTIYNAFFLKEEFSGMSTLYNELNVGDTEFYYISGSPHFVKNKVINFLEKQNFPSPDHLILKTSMFDSTYTYKVAKIEKLIISEKPDKVILIGDDTEKDPEVYETISQRFPNLVQSIYIHSIKNRDLPKLKNLKNYFAATEIAAREMIKGNLLSASLKRVADSFVDTIKGNHIFIPGRYCPMEGRAQIEELKVILTETSEREALDLTQQKIISLCR